MARPKHTELDRELSVARRTLAKIVKLDRELSPQWYDRMVAHWSARVEHLSEVKAARRQAH